jgi:hypothetical protein
MERKGRDKTNLAFLAGQAAEPETRIPAASLESSSASAPSARRLPRKNATHRLERSRHASRFSKYCQGIDSRNLLPSELTVPAALAAQVAVEGRSAGTGTRLPPPSQSQRETPHANYGPGETLPRPQQIARLPRPPLSCSNQSSCLPLAQYSHNMFCPFCPGIALAFSCMG